MAGTLLGVNMELAQWHADQEHRRDQELVPTPLLLLEELNVWERLSSQDHAKSKNAQVIFLFSPVVFSTCIFLCDFERLEVEIWLDY